MRTLMIIIPAFVQIIFITTLFVQQIEAKTRITDKLICGLDPKISSSTFPDYLDEIGNIFGAACGRNRGIFVLDPPDGHTYNCANFPEYKWGVKDANAVKKADPDTAVKVLDEFIRSVYLSSPEYIRARDPGACDFEAMSALTCGDEEPWKKAPWSSKLNSPIRGVNLGGLFILKKWITPSLFTPSWEAAGIVDMDSFSKKCSSINACGKYQEHLDTFFSSADFVQMKLMGLNTVRIPVGYWLFESLTSNAPSGNVLPLEHILEFSHPLTRLISMAMSVGLHVIIDLETIDTELLSSSSLTITTAAAIGTYVKHLEEAYSLHNVILIEIGTAFDTQTDFEVVTASIDQLRAVLPSIPIMLLESSALPSRTSISINTKVYHGFSVQDIASDTASADREKLYAHEKIACGFKAPLHFTTCTRAPTLVGEFSLAIDNCMPGVDDQFADYGQCDRISSRAASPWWNRHLKSFAMRQLATYEAELGWVFWTFKLDAQADKDPSAAYWSYRLAVQRGLIVPSSFGGGECDHYPAADYILGDDTLAPTPLPSFWVAPIDPSIPVEGSSAYSNGYNSPYNKKKPTLRPTLRPTKRPSYKPTQWPTKVPKNGKNAPTVSKIPSSVYGPQTPDIPIPGSTPVGEVPGVVPGHVPGEPEPGQVPPKDMDAPDTSTNPIGSPIDAPPDFIGGPGGVAGDVPVLRPNSGVDAPTEPYPELPGVIADVPVEMPSEPVAATEPEMPSAEPEPMSGEPIPIIPDVDVPAVMPIEGSTNTATNRQKTSHPTHRPISTVRTMQPTFPTGGDFKDGNGDTSPYSTPSSSSDKAHSGSTPNTDSSGSDPTPGQLPPGESPGYTPGQVPGETPGKVNDGKDNKDEKNDEKKDDKKDDRDNKMDGKGDKDEKDKAADSSNTPKTIPSASKENNWYIPVILLASCLLALAAYYYKNICVDSAYSPIDQSNHPSYAGVEMAAKGAVGSQVASQSQGRNRPIHYEKSAYQGV